MLNRYFLILAVISVFIFNTAVFSEGEELIRWKDCVSAARKNHPDLHSAKEKINQAKSAVGITRSELLPKVDASADITKSKTKVSNIPQSGNLSNEYSYGASGSQLLFDGGKAIYDLKSSKKNVDASEYNYQVVSSTVRQTLRVSFIQLLSTQEFIKTDRDIEKIRRDNYGLVNMRYKAGLEHMGSLLTADANLAQARFALSGDQRNLTLARRSLARSMGLDKFELYTADGELAVPDSYTEKPDLEIIAGSNPQLKEIIQQRISAEYSLQAARLDFLPKLFGIFGASRTGTKWGGDTATNYYAGVQMSFNIFQGGKSYYETSQADALYKQLFADEKSTQNTILFFLEQAWTNLRNDIENVGVQLKFLKAAEERARIADAQYSIGTILFDNWIIIQNTLVSAKQSLLNAETNALISEADWIQAKGGTLDYDE